MVNEAATGISLLDGLGGLGLFLLGMALLTEGLRNLAGLRLRQALLRFTRTPWSGALTGALATALMQSSTATTVATVGFVSAGLIGFQASLGIIFGANVGSTGLGWLVALLGLQLELAPLMLPLVFVGASLRLLGQGRVAQVGLALAGFALLLVGIGSLQAAMAGHGLLLNPGRFNGASLLGRLQLLLLGLLATLITHSSGAGVATTLAALAAQAIDLSQACALVIGMDLGTTVTAVLASLGASLSARRTAAAHVLFNLGTAVAAFLALPLYLQVVAAHRPGLADAGAGAGFALTAFHTGFNLVGVLVVLPFTRPFAALIRRLVPVAPGRLVDELDDRPPASSDAALDQAAAALQDLLLALIVQLRSHSRGVPLRPVSHQADLDRLEFFLDQIHLRRLDDAAGIRLLHLLHGLDHLQRLQDRCEEQPERVRTVASEPLLEQERSDLQQTLEALEALARSGPAAGLWHAFTARAGACAQRLHRRVAPFRREVLAREARGELSGEAATRLLEAMRWLRRTSAHLERIGSHLAQSRPA